MAGFVIWAFVGVVLIGLGMHSFFSKKEVAFGFWSNAKMFPVKNVKAYNRAVGKLWCVFGIVFILLGLPLLMGQNSPAIIISLLGAMAEVVVAMVVYTLVIERKYRRK